MLSCWQNYERIPEICNNHIMALSKVFVDRHDILTTITEFSEVINMPA
jgi:hypothetical protein